MRALIRPSRISLSVFPGSGLAIKSAWRYCNVLKVQALLHRLSYAKTHNNEPLSCWIFASAHRTTYFPSMKNSHNHVQETVLVQCPTLPDDFVLRFGCPEFSSKDSFHRHIRRSYQAACKWSKLLLAACLLAHIASVV